MRNLRSSRLALGLAVLLAAGLSAAAVAVATNNVSVVVTPTPTTIDSEGLTPRPVAATENPGGTVDTDAVKTFGVLRNGSLAATSMAAKMPEFSGEFGLVPAQARSVKLASGRTVTVTPGSTGLCIEVNGSVGCNPTSEAKIGHILGAQICGPSVPKGVIEVYGIVPDDVTAVTVDSAKGPIKSPVVDNVFDVDIVPPTAAATWNGGPQDGTTVQIPIPPGTDTSTCANAQ